MLYEKVELMQHTSAGLDIRIILIKEKNIDWPRLILSKQKTRNIHFDVAMIQCEEEHKKILELPKEVEDKNSDDEEIDVMYNVCSDLDSEFDDEIPCDSD